jgi:4-diphosphocytidyl-2-C-methyl-D-erythritol kinase
VHAHAKLTLRLHIVGVRSDGYHLLDAEMVALDLADTLTLTPGDGVEVAGPAADDVPVDGTNLAFRAMEVAGIRAHLHIHKEIPAGAGLGGGSSDAGAVLRWAGLDDPASAVRLGADVPFCASGEARARVGGVGEVVEPLAFEEQVVTLVIPPFGVSTAAVYAAWDRLGGPRRHDNDLEPAAIAVEPRLSAWKERITRRCRIEPTLAGSGATWFVPGSHAFLRDEIGHDARVVIARTARPIA